METFYIGAHVSSAKGYEAMGREAVAFGANTLAFFTRNPRGGRAKALAAEDVAAFRALARAQGFGPIVAHAPYTLNACAAKESLRTFARETLAEAAQKLGRRFVWALSLPGRTAPVTAGQTIARTVMQMLAERGLAP